MGVEPALAVAAPPWSVSPNSKAHRTHTRFKGGDPPGVKPARPEAPTLEPAPRGVAVPISPSTGAPDLTSPLPLDSTRALSRSGSALAKAVSVTSAAAKCEKQLAGDRRCARPAAGASCSAEPPLVLLGAVSSAAPANSTAPRGRTYTNIYTLAGVRASTSLGKRQQVMLSKSQKRPSGPRHAHV